MLLSADKKIMSETGYSIRNDNLSSDIKDLLNELEVNSINTKYTNCENITQIEFVTNWTTKGSVYFAKDSCDREQSKKGFHTKLSEMIEVWGLGDDWIMWIDYDFI